eukprot:CAMPEP_0196656632 /NCGR_PEP_ID=MMETSP1086-20130531/19001_1 /TAXON_ID=77921 /ORGANISM="Cyanoptyche  gloeocystis , Strain SAG4.97" /LENGTH=40 /DNA_ID= /DNA_START= /DNA_END= /DNA_ORIENTATION=
MSNSEPSMSARISTSSQACPDPSPPPHFLWLPVRSSIQDP